MSENNLRSTTVAGVLDLIKDLIVDARIAGKVFSSISIPQSEFESYIEVRFSKPHYVDPIIWITIEFRPATDNEDLSMFVLASDRNSTVMCEGFQLMKVGQAKAHFETLLALLDQYEDDTKNSES